MRRYTSLRRRPPIRLIPYAGPASSRIAVHGTLAVALDSGPPPPPRPPLRAVDDPRSGSRRKAGPGPARSGRTTAAAPRIHPAGSSPRTAEGSQDVRNGVWRDARSSAPRENETPGAVLHRDARLIARLVLDVLLGIRPYHQLAARTTPRVFEMLDSLAARVPSGPPPRLGTVRICEPGPGVAEVSVVARLGTRAQALALRLEHERGRWRCAAIETTVPPG